MREAVIKGKVTSDKALSSLMIIPLVLSHPENEGFFNPPDDPGTRLAVKIIPSVR